LVVGLLGLGSAFVGAAQASIHYVPAGMSKYNTTLQTWSGFPSVQDADLLYTFNSASKNLLNINPGSAKKPNADPSAPVQFAWMRDPGTGLDPVVRAVTLGGNKQGIYLKGGKNGATYDLDYSVQVVPGGKGGSFASASLGADALVIGSGPVTVVETLYNGNGGQVVQLTSTNGLAVSTPISGPGSISGLGLTSLKVDEVITVPAGDIVYDTTDTFCQNIDPDPPVHHTAAVPEPGAVIIWSLLGGLGLGVTWWRKRKAV